MSSSSASAANGPDTAAVRELLGMMANTMTTLGQTFDSLSSQSQKVATLGPQMESAHQIHQLRRAMRAQEKKQDARVNDVKKMIQDELKLQVADILKSEIKIGVREEIKTQTHEQVQNQLKERMPVALEDQATESSQQLHDVRAALTNAESRRANAILRASNLDDHLAVILKSNGEPSSLFPQDLKTLFSYDDEKAKQLVESYGLQASESREKNLNKFMAHAGIQFHLIPVPMMVTDANSRTNALLM